MIFDGGLKGKKRIKHHRVISDTIRRAKEQKTMKAAINILLDADPYLKPLQICKLMDWDYDAYGKTVAQRKYEWKLSLIYGLGSKSPKFAPDSQHHVRAFGYVPKCLDRIFPGVTKRALDSGWKLSKNPNRMLYFNEYQNTYGRVEWFETGRVNVHVRAPQHMGRVKKLVSLAFYENDMIFDTRIFLEFVDSFDWAGAHDEFRTSKRLPKTVIRAYEKLGFIIKTGDKSHPYSVEVEWAHPLWAEKIEFFLEQLNKMMNPPKKKPGDQERMYV